MSLDTLIPRDLITLLYVAVASILGWIGGWLKGRKRDRAEIVHLDAQAKKTAAETRQINANTDISLIQAAAQALARAERLQAERDHWEMKAFDLQVEVKELREENGQLTVQARIDNYQIRRQMAFIEARRLKKEYINLDTPLDDNPQVLP